MNSVIWKYVLKPEVTQDILLPLGAEVLSVQNQFESVCLWALVDPKETQTQTATVDSIGTGHELPEPRMRTRKFLGTVLLSRGGLVFHFFLRV